MADPMTAAVLGLTQARTYGLDSADRNRLLALSIGLGGTTLPDLGVLVAARAWARRRQPLPPTDAGFATGLGGGLGGIRGAAAAVVALSEDFGQQIDTAQEQVDDEQAALTARKRDLKESKAISEKLAECAADIAELLEQE